MVFFFSFIYFYLQCKFLDFSRCFLTPSSIHHYFLGGIIVIFLCELTIIFCLFLVVGTIYIKCRFMFFFLLITYKIWFYIFIFFSKISFSFSVNFIVIYNFLFSSYFLSLHIKIHLMSIS